MPNFGESPESKPEWDTPTEVIPVDPSKEATPEQKEALERRLKESWNPPAVSGAEEETLKDPDTMRVSEDDPTLKTTPE